MLPFDPNDGAGFWWANSLNTFTRNVAGENDQLRLPLRGDADERASSSTLPDACSPTAARKTVDIRTLPFVRFEDNEVHSSDGLYGINLGEGVDRVGPDARHPFVIREHEDLGRRTTASGRRSPSLLVENLHDHSRDYGVYHPNYDNHVYRNLHISETNTEPFNRGHDDRQRAVRPADGRRPDVRRLPTAMPLIQISDDNPTGKAASHFRNVKVGRTSARPTSVDTLVNLGGGPRPPPKTTRACRSTCTTGSARAGTRRW